MYVLVDFMKLKFPVISNTERFFINVTLVLLRGKCRFRTVYFDKTSKLRYKTLDWGGTVDTSIDAKIAYVAVIILTSQQGK